MQLRTANSLVNLLGLVGALTDCIRINFPSLEGWCPTFLKLEYIDCDQHNHFSNYQYSVLLLLLFMYPTVILQNSWKYLSHHSPPVTSISHVIYLVTCLSKTYHVTKRANWKPLCSYIANQQALSVSAANS